MEYFDVRMNFESTASSILLLIQSGFFPDIFLCGDWNIDAGVFESADQRFLCSSDYGEGQWDFALLLPLKKLFRVSVRYIEGNTAFGSLVAI